MGVPTGFAQFVADELDVPFDRVHRCSATRTTPSRRAASAAASRPSWATSPIRNVAARDAQHPLVDAAAQQLGVPATQLDRQERRHLGNRRPRRRCATPTCSHVLAPDPKFPLTGEAFSDDVEGPGAAQGLERLPHRRFAVPAQGRGAESVRALPVRRQRQAGRDAARTVRLSAEHRRDARQRRRILDQGHRRRARGARPRFRRRRRDARVGCDQGDARAQDDLDARPASRCRRRTSSSITCGRNR